MRRRARDQLWMLIIEGWEEKSQVNDPEGTKTLKEMTAALQGIIKRHWLFPGSNALNSVEPPDESKSPAQRV
jgi:hypothetical protein